jgi:hypothetical protein
MSTKNVIISVDNLSRCAIMATVFDRGIRDWMRMTSSEASHMRTAIVALAVLVFTGSWASAARAPDLSALPAELRGVVLNPDGRTPVDGLPVRVWDSSTEKVIFKTRTDRSGVFGVPELKEGDHYITVGSVRIDMRLLTARAGVTPQPHGLVIVVPRRLGAAPILLPTTLITAAPIALPQVMSP